MMPHLQKRDTVIQNQIDDTVFLSGATGHGHLLDDFKINLFTESFGVFVQSREPNIFRMVLDT